MEDEETTPKYLGFALEKRGNQFEVMPDERFRDENGTEQTRWVQSARMYFDTLDRALAYLKLCEGQLIG